MRDIKEVEKFKIRVPENVKALTGDDSSFSMRSNEAQQEILKEAANKVSLSAGEFFQFLTRAQHAEKKSKNQERRKQDTAQEHHDDKDRLKKAISNNDIIVLNLKLQDCNDLNSKKPYEYKSSNKWLDSQSKEPEIFALRGVDDYTAIKEALFAHGGKNALDQQLFIHFRGDIFPYHEFEVSDDIDASRKIYNELRYGDKDKSDEITRTSFKKSEKKNAPPDDIVYGRPKFVVLGIKPRAARRGKYCADIKGNSSGNFNQQASDKNDRLCRNEIKILGREESTRQNVYHTIAASAKKDNEVAFIAAPFVNKTRAASLDDQWQRRIAANIEHNKPTIALQWDISSKDQIPTNKYDKNSADGYFVKESNLDNGNMPGQWEDYTPEHHGGRPTGWMVD